MNSVNKRVRAKSGRDLTRSIALCLLAPVHNMCRAVVAQHLALKGSVPGVQPLVSALTSGSPDGFKQLSLATALKLIKWAAHYREFLKRIRLWDSTSKVATAVARALEEREPPVQVAGEEVAEVELVNPLVLDSDTWACLFSFHYALETRTQVLK